MKRVCNEAEKELLYKNRKQMMDGIYWTATRSKLSHVFAGIVFSTAVMCAGIVWAAVTFEVTKFGLTLWMLLSFAVSYIIFFVITSNISVKKEMKAFLKQKNLMVNGATIVEVGEKDTFAYIEDDVLDEDGKPLIIDYPSCLNELTGEDVGKRILVMYDDDSNFQLVRLNDELKGLISGYSSDYPLADEISEYIRVPHPNMIKVEKTEHELSERERASFADLYVKIVQGEALRMAKISGAVLFISGIVLCGLLSVVEGGYPLSQTVPIAAIGFVALWLFFWLMSCIGKVNLKRQGQFTQVKEIVFHSYTISKNSSLVRVYEWMDGQIQTREYPAGNVFTRTPYGMIMYKFTNLKGEEVLLNTAPIKKRNKK